MKTVTVPAQVTTVEDKVAGNISFTQLILLTTPVFLSGLTFAIMPPVLTFSGLKVVVSVALAGFCAILAIRIKGRIILSWIVTLARYYFRPRRYIYSKNDMYLRKVYVEPKQEANETEDSKTTPEETFLSPFAIKELVRVEAAVSDKRAGFEIRKSRKGVLNVHIKEIKN